MSSNKDDFNMSDLAAGTWKFWNLNLLLPIDGASWAHIDSFLFLVSAALNDEDRAGLVNALKVNTFWKIKLISDCYSFGVIGVSSLI